MIGIADSAIAKSRPLPEPIYTSLRLMGAPDPTEVIGYRNPFCGVFVKGAPPGSAAFALDKRAQSKTIIRLEVTVQCKDNEGKGTVSDKGKRKGEMLVELVDVTDDRTLVTDILGQPKAIAKVAGKLVFADGDTEAAEKLVACI